jgi:hypothetical protein
MERRAMFCLIAIILFGLSAALILQMPREDRRTLFIFPIFLSVVVGGGLTAYGFEDFSRWFVAAAIVPFLVVYGTAHFAPRWLLTFLSYICLGGALVFTDLLLDYGFS